MSTKPYTIQSNKTRKKALVLLAVLLVFCAVLPSATWAASYEVKVYETISIEEGTWGWDHRWSLVDSSDETYITLSNANQSTVSITALPAGEGKTISITHTYTYSIWGSSRTETHTITITAATPKTITFDANGATGCTVPDAITGKYINDTFTVPTLTAPAGSVNADGEIIVGDKVFVGWSTDANVTVGGLEHFKNPIYYVGDTYTITGDDILYAVWASQNADAIFYLYRGDTVAPEPSDGGSAGYTDAIATIAGTIKHAHFLFDDNSNLDENLVHNNLNTLPTTEQIQAVMTNYDPDKQKVMWYVMKRVTDGSWHVDGLILDKDKYLVSYNPGFKEFDLNKVPAAVQYAEGDTVTVEAAIRAEGWTFKGWQYNGNIYTPGATFTMPANDVQLTAQWIPNGNTEYKIETYLRNASSASYTKVSEAIDSGITGTVVAETKYKKALQGYTLDNVAFSSGTTPTILGDGSLVIKVYYTRDADYQPSITVTALDKEKEYDGISLTDSSYTISDADKAKLAYGDKIESVTMQDASTITYPGSVNNVINTVVLKDLLGNDVTEHYAITKQNGTLTIYPKITVQVTLDDMPTEINAIDGAITSIQLQASDGTVYALQGNGDGTYNSAALPLDNTTYVVYYQKGDAMLPFGDFAEFTVTLNADTYGGVISVPYYSVTYYKNKTDNLLHATEYYVKDSTVDVIDSEPTYSGMTFDGWNVLTGIADTRLLVKGQTLVTEIEGPITLAAQFSTYYPVTVSTYLDSVLTDVNEIHADVSLFLKDNAGVAHALTRSSEGKYTASLKAGTYFLYQKTGDAETKVKEYSITVDGNEDSLTVPHYSVVYDSNGGTIGTGSTLAGGVYEAGDSVTVSATQPQRAGFTFIGWNTAQDGTGTDYSANARFAIKEKTTLYAQWEDAVTVTVNVKINHADETGYDQLVNAASGKNKDELHVALVSRESETAPYQELSGFTLDFQNGMDGYERVQTWADGTTEAEQTNEHALTTTYSAKGACFIDLPKDLQYSVTAEKTNYDVTITPMQDSATGDWTIDVVLEFRTTNFDLVFDVAMDTNVPKALYPQAVIAKVLFWNTSNSQWETITQQEGNKPGVRVNIDASTGNGTGTYSVWRKDSSSDLYYYRIEITSYLYPDGTMVAATTNDQDVYTTNLYTGTMDVIGGGIPSGTALSGVRYFESSEDSETKQDGSLTATITAQNFTVTFDANGGTIDGSTNTQMVVEHRYKIPELTDYVPERAYHVFDGWYFDAACTQKAESGTFLTGNITLYAKWKAPLTITGTVLADGTYRQGDDTVNIHAIDRVKQVTVLLQKQDGTNWVTVADQTVDVSAYTDNQASNEYLFQNVLNDGSTYRILISQINYTTTYKNANSGSQFTADGFVAVFDGAQAVVDAHLAFTPGSYEQAFVVDAHAIGEGYRPSVVAQIYYETMGDNTDTYNIISQHTVAPYGVEKTQWTKGEETFSGSYSVWKQRTDGKPYGYQLVIKQPVTGKEPAAFGDDAPFTITTSADAYFNTAAGSPTGGDGTGVLRATLTPKQYDIVFDCNTTDAITGMAAYKTETGYLANYTWSHTSAITAVPQRQGYAFLGWFFDENENGIVDGSEALYTNDEGVINTNADWTGTKTLTASWQENTLNIYVDIIIDHLAKDGVSVNNDDGKEDIAFVLEGRPNGSSAAYTPMGAFIIDGDNVPSGYTKAYDDANANVVRYQATAETFANVSANKEYSVSTAKSGYSLDNRNGSAITVTTDDDGNQKIILRLVYDPSNFDFTYTVQLTDAAKALPNAIKPTGVNVKVTSFYDTPYDTTEDYGWYTITQHKEIAQFIALNEEGKGIGTYPVWRQGVFGDDAEYPYFYRIEIVEYVFADGTTLAANDNRNQHESYVSDGGNYVADIVVDATDAVTLPTLSGLTGAYYDAATNQQMGTVTAAIDIHAYDVAIDPNGGTIDDNANTIVLSDCIKMLDIASYTPERAGHTFTGWTWTGNPKNTGAYLTEDITLTANWEVNKYTITFVDEDGTTVLEEQTLAYGAIPAYAGETPTKEATAEYTYTFAGWTPEIAAVTGTTTYTATYTATVNEYTIQFVNEDGTTVLEEQTLAYGAIPAYVGETPTKEATAEYTYTFAGWTPEIVKVTGDATYTAMYSATVNEYTVTFENADGTELQSSKVAYGATPAYTGATPTKDADAQYTYTFVGWDPTIQPVTGDATYKATYTETAIIDVYVNVIIRHTAENNQGTNNAEGLHNVAFTLEKRSEDSENYTAVGTRSLIWDGNSTSVMDGYTVTYENFVTTYTATSATFDDVEKDMQYTVSSNKSGYQCHAVTQTEENGNLIITLELIYNPNNFDFTYTVSLHDQAETVSAKIKPVAVNVKVTSYYDSPYVEGETMDWYTITQHKETTQRIVLDAQGQGTGSYPVWKFFTGATTPYYYRIEVIGFELQDGTIVASTTDKVNYHDAHNNFNAKVIVDSACIDPGETGLKGAYFDKNQQVGTVHATVSITPYSVTYKDGVDATVFNDMVHSDLLYGMQTPKYDEPLRTGYTFAGWDPAVTETVTSSAIYIAMWDVNKYTVTFVNADGTKLQSSEVAYGSMPAYTGETPTKDADAQYTYTFVGWDKEIATVTGTETYTAKYSKTVNKYTIRFVNEDGKELQSSKVEYGATPAYTGDTPTKDADAQYTYNFVGWSPEIAAVTGDATYTAQFAGTTNKYHIIWKDSDQIVLETDDDVPYGTIPSYDNGKGTTAQLAEQKQTPQYSYTFAGWTPKVTAVTGSAIYMATYDAVLRSYDIVWQDWDDSLLELDEAVTYGSMPNYDGEPPQREGYVFAGWSSEVVAVTGNATYTAQYTPIDYIVSYRYDGTVPLGAPQVPNAVDGNHIGDTVTVATAPALDGFVFSGWQVTSPSGITITADGTFTMPAEHVVLSGSWRTAEDTQYQVAYYAQDRTGAYSLANHKAYSTTTGALVFLQDADKDASLQITTPGVYAYTITGDTVERTAVQGNGKTVLKAYFEQRFKVVFRYWDEKIRSAETVYETDYTYRLGDTITLPEFESSMQDHTGWYVAMDETIPWNEEDTISGERLQYFDVDTNTMVLYTKAKVVPPAEGDLTVTKYVTGETAPIDGVYDFTLSLDVTFPSVTITSGQALELHRHNAAVIFAKEQMEQAEALVQDANDLFASGAGTTSESAYAYILTDDGNGAIAGVTTSGSVYQFDAFDRFAVTPKASLADTLLQKLFAFFEKYFADDNTVSDEAEVLTQLQQEVPRTTGPAVSFQWSDVHRLFDAAQAYRQASTSYQLAYDTREAFMKTIGIDRSGVDVMVHKGGAVSEERIALTDGKGTYSFRLQHGDSIGFTFKVVSGTEVNYQVTEEKTAYETFDGVTVTDGNNTKWANGSISIEGAVTTGSAVNLVFTNAFKDRPEEDEDDDSDTDHGGGFVDNGTGGIPEELNGEEHFAYIAGYPDGMVKPLQNLTRAEVAAIFYRLLDADVRAQYFTTNNCFGDVMQGSWYNNVVSTMAAMGIVAGYPDGNFHPDAPITRAEFAAIAARFAQNGGASNGAFLDISGHWAEHDICAAAANGWIAGYADGTFRPNQQITRAEAMALVNRVLWRMPESPEDLLDGMILWPDNMDTNTWYYVAVQEATNSHTFRYKDGETNGKPYLNEQWIQLNTKQ